MAVELALVAEADAGGDLGGREALGEVGLGAGDPAVGDVGVGREADLVAEGAGEVELGMRSGNRVVTCSPGRATPAGRDRRA